MPVNIETPHALQLSLSVTVGFLLRSAKEASPLAAQLGRESAHSGAVIILSAVSGAQASRSAPPFAPPTLYSLSLSLSEPLSLPDSSDESSRDLFLDFFSFLDSFLDCHRHTPPRPGQRTSGDTTALA